MSTPSKPAPTMDPFTGKLSDGSRYFDRPPILAHALAMFTLFGFILPAAAFYARYYRTSSPRWMPVHAGIQTFAGLCVILAALPVMTNPIVCVKPHKYVGYVLLALIALQMLGGFAHFRSLVSSASRAPPKGIARNGRFHAASGVLILLLGFAQIPQGIHHDFRFDEQPWAPMYLVYYALVIVWLTLVAIKEVANMQSKASPFGNASAAPLMDLPLHEDDSQRPITTQFATAPRHSLLSNPSGSASHRPSLASSMTLADQTARDAIAMAKSANLRQLSWPEFDHYVTQMGKQWVVGPGGVVFDISTWITSHPGGQFVLLDAIGSNITTDYFNAEMFDQHRFKAFASRPEHVPDSHGIGGGGRRTMAGATDSLGGGSSSIATTRPSFLAGFHDGIIPTSAALALADRRVTQADWEHVLASRRTHVHSRTAIAKLAGMAVAWVPESGRRFDKHEYRRYALTHKVDLSAGVGGGDAQVHQLTFTLLYPNESYPEEPSFFLPGHSIELRMRLPRHLQSRNPGASSPYVTRFYTPLSGNMTHFTIALKLRPGGLMSTLLASLTPSAHRQIHIRGPFGTPLMNPQRPLPLGNGCYDHTLFLTVGTGVTPALQTLAFYFAQTYFEQVAHIAHPGLGDNELKVAVRDRVLIKYPLANGWVWATNTTTVTDGYVPLRCLVPWVGRAARMTVVAAERSYEGVIGRDLLELCQDGYPDQVQVHYRVQSPPAPTSPAAPPANLSVGKIDRAYVMHILHTSGYLARASQPGAQLKIGVCGPQVFLDACYDWLTEVVPEEHIWLLPVGTYLTLQGHQPLVAPEEYHQQPPSDQFRPLSVVSPTALSGFPVPSTPTGAAKGFQKHLDIGTLALPPSPGVAPPATGNPDGEDDGALFLPGLPVHVDPASQQSEWFYLPPETARRTAAPPGAGASVGQPPGESPTPAMVEIVVSEPGVTMVQSHRGSGFVRTR